jgi:hypothetical protein
MRRIEQKLGRQYPALKKLVLEASENLEHREKVRLSEELNRIAFDIDMAISAARRRGCRDAWSGRIR